MHGEDMKWRLLRDQWSCMAETSFFNVSKMKPSALWGSGRAR